MLVFYGYKSLIVNLFVLLLSKNFYSSFSDSVGVGNFYYINTKSLSVYSTYISGFKFLLNIGWYFAIFLENTILGLKF